MGEENADDVVVTEEEAPALVQPAQPPAEPPKFPPAPKVPHIPRATSSAGAPPLPMEYTTTIRQTVEPKLAGRNGTEDVVEVAPDAPQLRVRTTEQLVDQIGERGLGNYVIRVWTISPYAELIDDQGSPSVPQGPYADLIAHLRDTYGPGTYRIRVEHHGITVPAIGTRQVTITAPGHHSAQVPLVQPAFQPSFAPQQQHGQFMLSRFGQNMNAVDDEVRRLQVERQRIAALRELKREQAALEKESRLLLEDAPDKTEETALVVVKKELAELKTEMLKPKTDDIMKVLLAIIQAQMTKPPEPRQDNLKEMVSLITETNKTVMTAANEKSGEFKELALMLLTKKLDSGDDQLKTYLDLMDRGEARAMKMVDMMRGGDDGHVEIDPEHPWMSLGAQVATRGINALIDIFRTGAPAIQELIASRVGKPRDAVTQQDLSVLADQLQTVRPLRPPSPPMPTINPPPPIPQSAEAMPPPEMFEPAARTTEQIPAPAAPTEAAPIQTHTPPTVEGQGQAAPILPAAAGSPEPPQAVPVVVSATMPELMEQDLREKVAICIEDYMLVDLTAERPDHDWPSYAADKWPQKFKQDFVVCPGHEERISLIKKKVAPEVWAKVDALLAKPGPNMYCFQLALNALVSEITGIASKDAAPTT